MSNHSVLGKEWVEKKYNKNQLELISKNYNLDFLTSKLICNKDLNLEQLDFFLSPRKKHYLPNPLNFKDCDKALEVVFKHIKNKSKICIFGDYDVDGATSS